jgi:hypothetical protein
MIIAEHITVLVAKIVLKLWLWYARNRKTHLNHENYAYLGFMYTILDTEERALTLSLLKH